MARRDNNIWLLIILVALLVVFGAYTMWGKQETPQVEQHNDRQGEIEYVASPDLPAPEDDIEIIEASEEPAFQVGFGMGPGLYGSGRHTSEMIGN